MHKFKNFSSTKSRSAEHRNLILELEYFLQVSSKSEIFDFEEIIGRKDKLTNR